MGWKLQKKIQACLSWFPFVSFQALENSKAWASQEHDKLVNKLKMAIQEKDKTIGVSNQHHTAWLGVTVLNFLSFVILLAMPRDYLKTSCFFFPAKGLVESGREKDKMLKALQVCLLTKISSWSRLAFKLNNLKMTLPTILPNVCCDNAELWIVLRFLSSNAGFWFCIS